MKLVHNSGKKSNEEKAESDQGSDEVDLNGNYIRLSNGDLIGKSVKGRVHRSNEHGSWEYPEGIRVSSSGKVKWRLSFEDGHYPLTDRNSFEVLFENGRVFLSVVKYAWNGLISDRDLFDIETGKRLSRYVMYNETVHRHG